MIEHVNRPFTLFLRWKLKCLASAYLRVCRGFRVVGKTHLPDVRKPCILVCNHAAFVDSVYMICAVRPRFTICGAKPKYFQRWHTRFLFGIANILKVENKDQFLADCGQLLDAGEVLLIYPEMGRYPDRMGAFKTWAAEAALSRSVPVIPCYLYGTTKGQNGPKRLIVGSSLSPVGTAVSFTETMRDAVLRLKPEPKGH